VEFGEAGMWASCLMSGGIRPQRAVGLTDPSWGKEEALYSV
jgi:hypothetical protein